MHSLRHLLRRKESDGKLGTKSPKSPLSPLSPKSPKSPKSPRSPRSPDFCKTEKNFDYLNQCAGCNNVEILIRRNSEQQKNGLQKVPSGILHNSFDELDKCARKCEICRVFRQALVLEEVTFDGVKELQNTPGEVMVHWEETTAADGKPKVFLNVELKGQLGRAGVVNCNSQNDIGHLALFSDGIDSAVIEQAKGWLDTCVNTHVGQCDNLRWSSENPRLLVEILSATSVRLCENQEGEYVALSYCWGNMQLLSQAERDEVERGKTLLANLNQRREPFPMSDLPTTVRDALHIIHAMGLRYAWVDTLCIVQDKPEGVATMHKVYSNALFTLCACATTRATAKLLDQREAWTQRTEPCRLGGQWLTTPDMSLNELRLRSPLAERAWTLQEERLSPRMLYVSSNRVHWSCAKGHEMEMKPAYGQKATPLHRPVYSASDRDTQMPLAQEFLLACYSGTSDLHAYWADIVKSYALRSMSNLSDRFTALSGLAAKYLSASRGDEYLAGMWANHLAEGLAWRLHQSIDSNEADSTTASPSWPSWSWAVLPLQTAIETNAKSARSSFFKLEREDGNKSAGARSGAEDAVRRGEQVKEISVTGRVRTFRGSSSRRTDWSTVSRLVDGEEKFSFAANPEQDVHAIQAESGRVLVYEDRKKEVVGQLDFRRDVNRVESDQMDLWALELGASTMLLLEHCGEGRWRRVGVAWDVRQSYFDSAECDTLILR